MSYFDTVTTQTFRQYASSQNNYNSAISNLLTVGSVAAGATTYASTTASFFLNVSASVASWLDSFSVDIESFSGPFTFLIFTPTGTANQYTISSFTVNPYTTGLNTFMAGVDYPAVYVAAGAFFGGVFGNGAAGSGVSTKFTSAGGNPYYQLTLQTSGSVTVSGTPGNAIFVFQVSLRALTSSVNSASVNQSIAQSIRSLVSYENLFASGSTVASLGTVAPQTTAYVGGASSFMFSLTATASGWLDSFSVDIEAYNGPYTFLIFTPTGTANQFTISSFTVTPYQIGVNTFYAGADYTPVMVTAGVQFGAVLSNGIGSNPPSTKFTTAGGNPFYQFASQTSGVVTLSGTPGNAVFQIQVNIRSASSAVATTTASTASASRRTLLLSESFSGTSMPSEWSVGAGSAWTVNNGITSPSSGGGTSSYIVCSKAYGLQQRTIRIQFSLVSAASILVFGGRGGTGSWVTIDNTTQTLSIAGSPSQSVPFGFTMATGQSYTCTVTLNDRILTATLADTLTGITATVSSGSNTLTTYTIDTPWGYWQDYDYIQYSAGQFTVLNYTVLANMLNPDVLYEGDSITYGHLNTIAGTASYMLRAAIPNASLLISGRGGAGIGLMNTHATTELVPLTPRITIFADGTNDALGGQTLSGYSSGVNSFIATAAGVGSKVVLCCIPTCAATGSVQSVITSFNNFLLGLLGTNANVLAVVRFDLATSIGNDGVTQNTAMFNTDFIHPNPTGGAAMFARFAIDAPMLFD